MNRESKIGMLVGLAVIVVIGVLLSQYFERGSSAERPALMADVKEGYRQSTQEAVGVPVLAGATGGTGMEGPGGRILALKDSASPLPAFATDSGHGNGAGVGGGPVIGNPVAAIPAGNIPEALPAGGQTSLARGDAGMSGMQPTAYVAGDPTKVVKSATPTGKEYVIVKGDGLMTIAKKHYHSVKPADMARIIAANPKELKDDKSPLIVGHKLLIPDLPKPEVKEVMTVKLVAGGAVIGLPGSDTKAGKTVSNEPVKIEAPRPTTYTVEKGDSLEKIAGKLLGSRTKAPQLKIATLNKLKEPYSLQSGQVLKIPAKAAPAAADPEAPKAKG